ncbi:class I SAM-dependent DNA methyltransferase [Streptomyces sp. NPDC048172]|uniref:class I SAM-dependent DNA methyltransferase n=1 Tax=Streptomyces sp. NPDC048172 TaxID=3365505 RepID=UPI003711E376
MSDVQYGSAVSSVYDILLSDPIPARDTVDFLRDRVAGKDVLELGVGTGRIAEPLAPLVRSLTGVDNSPHMLEGFRHKGVPGNVTLVEADFRAPVPVPLPTGDRFDAAYSTLGSLACCRDRDELRTALRGAAGRLRPGGVLCLEYYSADTYRLMLQASPFASRTAEGHPFEIRLALDPVRTVLTSATTISVHGEKVDFAEDVLLLEADEVERCLTEAGFAAVETLRQPGQPFDWYVAHVPSGPSE